MAIIANNLQVLTPGQDLSMLPWQDATNRDIKNMPSVQLYAAGPPCQGVSAAGKKRGADALLQICYM